jgi:2-polyprenyl-3-methyl-5-hydroxy-6-metoxy-1,4-benzoquinol methylase
MYKKITKCPLCKSKDIRNLIICEDHLVSGESFAINVCADCTFKFTNPRPINEALHKYYQSEHYISHTSKANSLRHFLYKTIRSYTLKKKLKLVNSLSNKGNILDVGCGTGEFLKTCSNANWNIHGIEPDQKAREKAEKLLGIKLMDSLFNCTDEYKYQIITLWHVLEHLPELNKTIQHLKNILSARGRLIFALPNVDSYDAKKYKEYWAAYDVPRHLYHFSQFSFKKLMKNHNLKVESIHPMKFDSYYVSLLSESYKNKFFNYSRALISGWLSNSYARKNKNNYSSLIYIVKK